MGKQDLYQALRKDIEELRILVDGIQDMDQIPPVIVELANVKLENISACFLSLKELSKETKISIDNPKPDKDKEETVTVEDKDVINTQPADVKMDEKETTVAEEENKKEKSIGKEKSKSINEQLASNRKNTVDTVVSGKKVGDLRKALNLNDRFRLQRELFNDNLELMNKTLVALNEMQTFSETISYIEEHFEWNKEDEVVMAFIQILESRF